MLLHGGSKVVQFFARRNLSSHLDHLVKPITVTNIGESLYPELKKKWPKLYKNIPPEGVSLTVDYLDTGQSNRKFSKTLLAVHGMTDTYRTFTKLVEHYLDTDVRVIAPNLPDFTHTRKHNFWHTSEEKILFLRNFLRQLNVDSVDCLVSHSFGVHANAGLWNKVMLFGSFSILLTNFFLSKDSNVKIKSVAMFAPQTFLAVDRSNLRIGRAFFPFNHRLWFDFLELLRVHKLPSGPLVIKFATIDDALWTLAGAFDIDAPKLMRDRLATLVELNIPTVVVFGIREQIIKKAGMEELNRVLQVPPNNILTIDPSKVNDIKLKPETYSFTILEAGHFVHSNYSHICNRFFDELLRLV